MRALFDRISAPASTNDAAVDVRSFEIASIESELNRLLNSRSYFNGSNSTVNRTILDYGLEDIVSRGYRDGGKLAEVTNTVRRTIESYEPRIYGISVAASYVDGSPIKALVSITGRLKTTDDYVQFKVPLSLPESVS